MSKILVVFGATGNQGGGLVNHVLKDPTLSSQYSVRAVTRDPSSSSSQTLSKAGASVVAGNLDNLDSIASALKDAHTVFLPTLSIYDDQLVARELRQGKSVADAAIKAGVSNFIYSSLVNSTKVTKGKIANMQHFDTKADVEDYIRSLPFKATFFFQPGSFMQNFAGGMGPKPVGDGVYALFNFVNPDTQFPLIDTVGDTGKYLTPFLLDPATYNGRVAYASTYHKTLPEVAEIMSKATGKKVIYQQMPREQYESFFPEKLMGACLCDMFLWIQDYGYYGPESEAKVKETVELVGKGGGEKLTTLEEQLAREPLKLD